MRRVTTRQSLPETKPHAFWEPLTFEDDITLDETAPAVTGKTYIVQPRSIVVLRAQHESTLPIL